MASVRRIRRLPASPERLHVEGAVALERRIARDVGLIEDIDAAREWLAQAEALATYLEHKDAHQPMLGAMRRIEARIGELLGPAEPKAGPGRGKPSIMNDGLSRNERREFRLLAAAVQAVLGAMRRIWGDCAPQGTISWTVAPLTSR